ncbi:AMP-binding protein [Corynebacterium sp. zg254]|uniref:AMP-binding protein n=1 Tax=Corynebacterium zhongnanshanii TaxID=2768834 RepID=A0ABQ6VEF2_9CORY|nr:MULTISPECIES: AMP-binding protein [Corynebacterium]KAB3522807.1 AMP-binding protein [Corynebacterium zhongnanshanii]MCR5914127.1 AMP-binding protein [Corynebacterium sp. zg254]
MAFIPQKTLNKLKWNAEYQWANVYGTVTGIGTVLKSGLIVQGGGLKQKRALVEGVYRWGFTAARQLYYAASAAPDRVAVIDDIGTRTYAELLADSEALGRALKAKGYGTGSRIGVMARNSRVMINLLAAKGFIGADIFLLNVASSPAQLEASIDEHNIEVLFLDEEFAEHLPADYDRCEIFTAYAEDLHNPKVPNPNRITFQQLIDQAPSEAQEPLPKRPVKGNIIIMSSGTSGTPKGVRHREPLWPVPLVSIITQIPWRAEMMVQMSASMFHSWGWACVNLLLGHRSTVILRRVFDPQQAMEDMDKYKAEALITSPIFSKEQLRVAQQGDYAVDQVEFVVSSGNAMNEDLLRGLQKTFGPVVCNFYGSTENSVVSIASPQQLLENPATAGTVANGVRVKVLDDEGNPLPPNQPGRVYARGIMTMRAYTNSRDTMTEQHGLLEIGDRGYLDENGQLFILGRADDMIIVGGENVYPRSLEEILVTMPGIRDLFIKGVKDSDTFARLAAWVVPEDSDAGRALTLESIQQWAREHLAEHSVPRDVTFMDELPRNPTGKVMPRMLPGADQLV